MLRLCAQGCFSAFFWRRCAWYTGFVAIPKTIPTRPVSGLILRVNYWLVTHRLLLKRLLAIGLGAFCIGIYGYAFGIVFGLARGQEAYRAMMASFTQDLIDYRSLRPLISPQPLQSGVPSVLPAPEGLADLIATVVNPNQKFAVPVLWYRFSDDQGELASGDTFIMPGETKYVVSFGSRTPVGQTTFTLAEVNWQRLNPEEFAKLREEKLRVVISGLEHRTAADLGPLASRLGGQTVFAVKNDSIFGYWDVALYVLLKNGGKVEAAQFARIRKLDPGQEEFITVNWTQSLPPTTEVSVVPELNLFDADSFYDYQYTGPGFRR